MFWKTRDQSFKEEGELRVSELLRVELGEDGDWPLDLAAWRPLPST